MDGNAVRWQTTAALVDSWFGASRKPAITDDAIAAAEQRLGYTFPARLREWIERFGERSDIWQVQDRLLRLDRIERVAGALIIGIENQGVVSWGIDMATDGEDPPVLQTDGVANHHSEWTTAAESISTFALQNALLAVKFAPGEHACGQAEDGMIAALSQALPLIDVPITRWLSAEFYGSLDGPVLAELDSETWLWISAHSREDLDRTLGLIGADEPDWDQFSP